jgi:cytochrome c553
VCSDCHGTNGVSVVKNFPNLAGQKEMYLAKQLEAFRTGTRKNNEMKFIVKLLSDADIANLAAYFSKLPCCKPEYR